MSKHSAELLSRSSGSECYYTVCAYRGDITSDGNTTCVSVLETNVPSVHSDHTAALIPKLGLLGFFFLFQFSQNSEVAPCRRALKENLRTD